EILKIRGFKTIDHAPLQRGVISFSHSLEREFRKRKKRVGTSWNMDETYIKVNLKSVYLYRAVDQDGQTIDFLLRKKRDTQADKQFFRKTIKNNGVTEKMNIDKSGSNTDGIKAINKENDTAIIIRRNKYMNNHIEQDIRLKNEYMSVFFYAFLEFMF
ncbi:IS6 family transposase, partial [Candidatus Marinamargulisbacteria bacterium SCGC AAA071-K20]